MTIATTSARRLGPTMDFRSIRGFSFNEELLSHLIKICFFERITLYFICIEVESKSIGFCLLFTEGEKPVFTEQIDNFFWGFNLKVLNSKNNSILML
jgi:hypothetical protein